LLFGIPRHAEPDLKEEEGGEALREAAMEALRERCFQPVARIDFVPDAAPEIRRTLMECVALDERDMCEAPELIDCTDLVRITGLDLPALRGPPRTPLLPARTSVRSAITSALPGSAPAPVWSPATRR
jgi:polyphosphate kinase